METTDWRDSMKVAREQAEGRLAALRMELKTLQDREKAVRAEIDEAMIALGQKRAPKKTKGAEAPKPRRRTVKLKVEAPAAEQPADWSMASQTAGIKPEEAAPETPPAEDDVLKYPEGAEVRCARIRPERCKWAGKREMLVDDHCPVCECNVVPIPEEA